ncbi:MAG: hypothetical protein Q8Q65_00410 [bacterium]|nr:hypothetical protein [bacterium]
MNPGNVFLNGGNSLAVVDQTMLFGSPALVPAKLLFGWRRVSNSKVDTLSYIDVNNIADETERVMKLDNQFLDQFSSFYPSSQAIIRQVGACQIIRHARGLMRFAKENPDKFIDASHVIKPFLEKDIDIFHY